MNILQSTDAYEAFLRNELGAEVVNEGLHEKREEMATGPFPFLRATYWRWAETIGGLAPELADAPRVLAIGDIHLENFGTWRDADGRLVWGVNDYDEAADMPYAYDLVRLTTSALLAGTGTDHPDIETIADTILSGYRNGLSEPRPFILDRDLAWLRHAVIVPEEEREDFWRKLEKKRQKFVDRPAAKRPILWRRYREALMAAVPPGATGVDIWYRSAGLGSLGRPRWVARAQWCGDWVIREAKGMVPSAWTRVDGHSGRAIRCMEIANGRYRATDPWFRVTDGIAVRRLSPNNRKIGAANPAKDQGKQTDAENSTEKKVGLDLLLDKKMLDAMGRELAAVHLGTRDSGQDIAKDVAGRKAAWLKQAAAQAAQNIRDEQTEFARSWNPEPRGK